MTTILTTIIFAIILVLIAFILIGIGRLLTGKSKIRPGACGRDPNSLRDSENCGTNVQCTLCEKPKEKPSSKESH